MELNQLKDAHDLYLMYLEVLNGLELIEVKKAALQEELQTHLRRKDELETQIGQYNINELVFDPMEEIDIGSPLHKRLEATLHEYHISRDAFKRYVGVNSMKYITYGDTKKFLDNPEVYRDAINNR